MSDSMRDRLARYYGEQKLDSDALQRLRDGIAEGERSVEEPEPRDGANGAEQPIVPVQRVTQPPWAWAAAAIALLALGFAFGTALGYGGQRVSEYASLRGVAAEIALNHNKQLEPEIRTNDYGAIKPGMPKLDFNPAAPDAVLAMDAELVGARYCSIGRDIAAQLRLEGDANETMTLYQLRGSDAPRDLETSRFDIDGVRVTLWREDGLLMGLAESLP